MIKAVIFDCFGVVLDVMRNFQNKEVTEAIQCLKGEYKLAMLSNVTSRRSLDERFPPGTLDELFDVVVASGDVGFEKPSPHIFTMTAEKLQVQPEECLFVDDIESFCRAAEAVGMQSLHFVNIKTSLAELRQRLTDQAEATKV